MMRPPSRGHFARTVRGALFASFAGIGIAACSGNGATIGSDDGGPDGFAPDATSVDAMGANDASMEDARSGSDGAIVDAARDGHDADACESAACLGCGSGFHLCGVACVSDSSVNSCGTRCAPCVQPDGGSVSCVSAPDGGVVVDGGLENFVCRAKEAIGTGCAQGEQCASGFCVEGVCCDALCAGSCDACTVANGALTNGTCAVVAVGAGGAPSCSPLVCNGSASCPSSCADDAECAAGFFCDGSGTCSPQKTQGGTCNPASDCKTAGCRECTTGHCADGFCCNTTCSGSCATCSAAKGSFANGTCASQPPGAPGTPSCTPFVCSGSASACPTSCTGDGQCGGTFYCDNTGTCMPRKASTDACDIIADCKVIGCRECLTLCVANACN